jgi:hypothetical protein
MHGMMNIKSHLLSYTGNETWSLTLREEHRLRMFEKRVLRKTLGAKSEDIKRDWRKFHNAELQDL